MEATVIDRLTVLVVKKDAVGDVSAARQSLEAARAELDFAVAALPDVDGDEAMATPALVALLVGAVRAKEHLTKVEAILRAPPELSLLP